MTRALIACLSIWVSAATAESPATGNAAAGERLHAAHCTTCHDSGVYTRKDRQVRTLEALNLQFETCSHAANKSFTAVEVRDLTKFLNDRYYHFR